MIDPVIDKEGNTFERQAILRWLVLYDQASPLTGNNVKLEELMTDTVVKGAIDKARKDAWVRYILDFEKDPDGSASPMQKQKPKLGESNSISPKSSPSKKKIVVTRSTSEYKSPNSSKDKSKVQVERMPSLPIHVEKNKKKVTPSPPSKAPTAHKLTPPPPPPKSNKRTHSNKSSHSETKSLSDVAPPVTQPIAVPQVMSSNMSACSNITSFFPHNG